MLLDFPVAA